MRLAEQEVLKARGDAIMAASRIAAHVFPHFPNTLQAVTFNPQFGPQGETVTYALEFLWGGDRFVLQQGYRLSSLIDQGEECVKMLGDDLVHRWRHAMEQVKQYGKFTQ